MLQPRKSFCSSGHDVRSYADRACDGAADTIALCGRRCEGSVEVSAIGPEASASHATRIYGGRLEKRKRTNDDELRRRLVCYPLCVTRGLY